MLKLNDIQAPRGANREKKRRGRGGGAGLSVTVSIGAAASSHRWPRPEQVIRAADRALYRAKQAGRNQVRWAGRR